MPVAILGRLLLRDGSRLFLFARACTQVRMRAKEEGRVKLRDVFAMSCGFCAMFANGKELRRSTSILKMFL